MYTLILLRWFLFAGSAGFVWFLLVDRLLFGVCVLLFGFVLRVFVVALSFTCCVGFVWSFVVINLVVVWCLSLDSCSSDYLLFVVWDVWFCLFVGILVFGFWLLWLMICCGVLAFVLCWWFWLLSPVVFWFVLLLVEFLVADSVLFWLLFDCLVLLCVNFNWICFLCVTFAFVCWLNAVI